MASGSSLSKGIFVLLFIGAVFMGLTFLLDKAPEQTPIASTPSSGTGDHANDPAVAEARDIGSEIGARIGEEIGRRVGETLVANLDMPAEEASEPVEESTLMADASEEVSDETPVEEESVSDPVQPEAEATPEPEVADEPELIAAVEPEPETESVAEEEAAPEPEVAEVEDYSAEETTSDADIAESEEQTAAAPAVETEPDPSKKFVFASSGWWNQSSGGNGFSVKHVGQAVTATGIKSSIVVILSAPFNGSQSLEDMIKIKDSAGSAVSGTWRRSANSRNLFFRVVEPGTYQVSISSELSSRDGVSLGETLSGPITIH